ncbi:RNA 2',3'-cyclic phosphodiesterase [Sphingomonas ginkgonis]|uniref:RNA 2',3'-cyclic phosphodiesterase n=1 Tax=Sphingomonas ginkgonis TaxID=2315330 RepID=A0A3R9WU34_9SPHN|nr:RNA 2',3'-cyclic phosphodiesterase [Sphingomonas ginkgonis]RST31844.1 RNA 2',3'-cyclic phosphodiesterase [Sphingomonas ginkgonis]
MHRLFVALVPPEPVRDHLLDIAEESEGLRWVGEDNLHLTLRFIGEVERPLAEDLAAALATVRSPAFALRLAGVGTFDRRGGGALWAAVQPREAVAQLAAKIDRACSQAGLEPEHRAFHPHLTLARWNGRRPGSVPALLEQWRGLPSDPFEVAEFTLFESRLSRHGAHYEAIASQPLV